MKEFHALLSQQPILSKEACDATINEWLAEKGLGYGKCMNPFRVAVIGYAKGPHMLDVAEIIGKEETLARLQRAIEIFPTIIGHRTYILISETCITCGCWNLHTRHQQVLGILVIEVKIHPNDIVKQSEVETQVV